MPAFAALIALGLDEVRSATPWFASVAALLILYPIGAGVAASALASGVTHVTWPAMSLWQIAPAVLLIPAWRLEQRGLRLAALFCLAVGATIGIAYLKIAALPEINRFNSARSLAREIAPIERDVCVDWLQPPMRYSLNYYTSAPLPDCAQSARAVHIAQPQNQPPKLLRPQ